MHPKISIILPVYNAETYLEETIHSILEQTFSDWQLIILNDASTDGSSEILKKYSINSKFEIFHFAQNKGAGYARNFGISKARGEYLVFLDADDFMAHSALELLNDFSLKKSKVDVFVWGFKSCASNGRDRKTYLPSKPDKKKGETPFHLAMLERKGFIVFPWVYAVKRMFVKRHSITFSEGVFFEDVQFSTLLLYYAEQVSIIEQACYNYRKHPNSVTGKSSKQKIDDKFTAFASMKTFLEQQGVFQQYKSLYLARFLATCVHTSFNEYFNLPRRERDKELDEYMLNIRKSRLLRNENLLLLLNLGVSLPKNEEKVRKGYLSAYYGLKAIKNRYVIHRFSMKLFNELNQIRKSLFNG